MPLHQLNTPENYSTTNVIWQLLTGKQAPKENDDGTLTQHNFNEREMSNIILALAIGQEPFDLIMQIGTALNNLPGILNHTPTEEEYKHFAENASFIIQEIIHACPNIETVNILESVLTTPANKTKTSSPVGNFLYNEKFDDELRNQIKEQIKAAGQTARKKLKTFTQPTETTLKKPATTSDEIDIGSFIQADLMGANKEQTQKWKKLAAQVADELYNYQREAFLDIKPQELLNYTPNSSKSISTLAGITNRINEMVVRDILSVNDTDSPASIQRHIENIVNFYAMIAKESIKKGDFATAFAISSGINNFAVSRLITDMPKVFTELDILFNSAKNFANLEAKIDARRKKGKAVIYPSNLITRKITFANENKEKIDEKINTEKKELQGKILQNTQELQTELFFKPADVHKHQTNMVKRIQDIIPMIGVDINVAVGNIVDEDSQQLKRASIDGDTLYYQRSQQLCTTKIQGFNLQTQEESNYFQHQLINAKEVISATNQAANRTTAPPATSTVTTTTTTPSASAASKASLPTDLPQRRAPPKPPAPTQEREKPRESYKAPKKS